MNIIMPMVVLAAIMMPVPVAAQPKARLNFTPKGPWAVEYGEQQCRLIRNFSDGRSEITLAYERFGFGPAIRLGLVGSILKSPFEPNHARFRYGSDAKSRESELQRMSLTDGRSGYFMPSASLLTPDEQIAIGKAKPADMLEAIAQAEIEAAKKISTISISEGFANELAIKLGSMSEPMKAMQTCITDLVTSWGMDPQRLAKMTSPPTPMNNPLSWVTAKDYPPNKLKEHAGGIVHVRLIITEEGQVANCLVDVETQGEFEKAACNAILKRARFKPGLDADGKPIRSYWVSGMRFVP